MVYVIRDASGVADGVNRVFASPAAYRPGTVSVWLNGQAIPQFVELGGLLVELDEAPRTDDTVSIGFVPLL